MTEDWFSILYSKNLTSFWLIFNDCFFLITYSFFSSVLSQPSKNTAMISNHTKLTYFQDISFKFHYLWSMLLNKFFYDNKVPRDFDIFGLFHTYPILVPLVWFTFSCKSTSLCKKEIPVSTFSSTTFFNLSVFYSSP